jgi:hypothetical protein
MLYNSEQRFKRLKLDKFVSGTEQRIFKTTTTHVTPAIPCGYVSSYITGYIEN